MRRWLVAFSTVILVALRPSVGAAVEPASEQVNPFYGSFGHSIPIAVPPFRGLEPAVALAYTSEGRNGFVGVGWGLAGFSTVERVNPGRGTPRFDSSDIYLLDGMELMPCGTGVVSAGCAAGGTHTTKDETYLKIVQDPGTNTWTVYGRDGSRTVLSPLLSTAGSQTFRWGVGSRIDTKANTVTYGWACLGSDCFPANVTYNGYRVVFFAEPRPDLVSWGAQDQVRQLGYRLRSVLVGKGVGGGPSEVTTPIRAYKLAYAQSDVTGRSLLQSVQVFGKDVSCDGTGLISGGTALPPMTFGWQGDSLGRSFTGTAVAPPTGPTTEPVAWTNRINTDVVWGSNTLKKRLGGSSAWNAGANSTRAIASGDGYLEIRGTPDGQKIVGLSHGDSGTEPEDIDYGLYEASDESPGQLYAYENGVMYGPWPYNDGDRLRVTVQAGVVHYSINGVVKRAARGKGVFVGRISGPGPLPKYPLRVDASILQQGATIQEATISGLLLDDAFWCSDTFLTGDFNGDGRTDQLCHSPVGDGTSQVRLSTGSGFTDSQTWLTGFTLGSPVLGDFNADGRTDLGSFVAWDGMFYVALSTGTGFATSTYWGYAVGAPGQGACRAIDPGAVPVAGSGDFNGDGITDVSCKLLGTAHPPMFVGISNGSSGFSFSVWGQGACSNYERVGSLDFDGDGKDDWYCMGLDGAGFKVFPSTGSSFVTPPVGYLPYSFCPDNTTVLADVNADGRTDVACTGNGKVGISTGSIFVETGTAGDPWCQGETDVFAADLDGDGAAELVCNKEGAGETDIEVREWTPDGGLGPPTTWAPGLCSGRVTGGDFDGDGKTDLLCKSLAAPVAFAGTSGRLADVVSAVDNGTGGLTSIGYGLSTSYPTTHPTAPRHVVERVRQSDGRDGDSETTFSYSGAYMDRKERRFVGFREVVKTLPCVAGESSCPTVKTLLRQDIASQGRPEEIQFRDGNDRLLTKQVFEYTTNGTTTPRISQLTGEWAYAYETDCRTCRTRRTYATHQYDAWGNRTETLSHGDFDQAGDEVRRTSQFFPNTSTYVVGAVASDSVFDHLGAKVAETRYQYDGALDWTQPPTQGYATARLRWLDREARFVTAHMGYDSWGNLTSVTDETNRTTTTTYDTTHHMYPETVTNAATESRTTTWDPLCGTPTQSFDENAQVTTFQSDNLCRPWRMDGPLGLFEERSYQAIGDPENQHVRVETPSPSPEDSTGNAWALAYFDGLGRTYRTESKGPSTGQEIHTWQQFDARGRVVSVAAPHYTGETPRVTTYTNDALGRLRILTHPDLARIQQFFTPFSVTSVDEHGHSTVTDVDVYGRRAGLHQFIDGQTVTTHYQYDALGRMTGLADALGHQWSWGFDSLGRNHTKTDPDAGTWSYSHDDAGRTLLQTDAKSQQTSFTYDAAGRLWTRTNPDETVTFRYGEPRSGHFNVAKLTSVDAVGRPLAIDYDALGRVVHRERVLDGVTYSESTRLDSAGRLRGITFPDGDAVGTPADPIRYDAAGRVYSVPGIVSAVTYDASGNPLVRTNSNLTETSRTYSAARGFLTGITTYGNGATVQDLTYTPDDTGMVQTVTSPKPDESWTYGYDALHRLTSASAPGRDQTFTYDILGRMTFNSEVGAYTYSPSRPHAPDTIAGQQLTYDLNGNMLTGRGRTITWTAANLPSQVNGAAFTYGGQGERVKKTSAGVTSLYPLGDDYEITNGVVTKYLALPGLGLIAKRVGAETFWLHTDRLGSVQAVTAGDGSEVLRRTYRPYGEKIADSGSHTESRGYIGQRADDGTDLLYLHARYYDPEIGAFLSADPAGVDGGLHLYGYGLGDPVNSADPSGLGLLVCKYVQWSITTYDSGGHLTDTYVGGDWVCTPVGANPVSAQFGTPSGVIDGRQPGDGQGGHGGGPGGVPSQQPAPCVGEACEGAATSTEAAEDAGRKEGEESDRETTPASDSPCPGWWGKTIENAGMTTSWLLSAPGGALRFGLGLATGTQIARESGLWTPGSAASFSVGHVLRSPLGRTPMTNAALALLGGMASVSVAEVATSAAAATGTVVLGLAVGVPVGSGLDAAYQTCRK